MSPVALRSTDMLTQCDAANDTVPHTDIHDADIPPLHPLPRSRGTVMAVFSTSPHTAPGRACGPPGIHADLLHPRRR